MRELLVAALLGRVVPVEVEGPGAGVAAERGAQVGGGGGREGVAGGLGLGEEERGPGAVGGDLVGAVGPDGDAVVLQHRGDARDGGLQLGLRVGV